MEFSKLVKSPQSWVQVVQEKLHYWTFFPAESTHKKAEKDLPTIWNTITKPSETLPIMWCKSMFLCKPWLSDKLLNLPQNSNLICQKRKGKKRLIFWQRRWNWKSVWTHWLEELSWKVCQEARRKELQLLLNWCLTLKSFS